MADGLSHVEGGSCWCDDLGRRVAALDVLYPDRCPLPLLSVAPSEIPDDPNGAHRTCVLVAGHREPCRGSLERPGEPCHFYGAPTDPAAPAGRPPCSACWVDLTTLALADIKALFAAGAPEFDLTPRPGD